MNILVIGNGFDLAHGLPTKYTDFLEFVKVIKQIIDVKKQKEIDWGDVHAEIKILIEKNLGNVRNNLHSQSPMWRELLDENVWIDYFLQCDMHGKENWIDFESEIKEVIKSLDNAMGENGLYQEVQVLSNQFFNDKYTNNIAAYYNAASRSEQIEVEKPRITFKELRDILICHLNKLIKAFEIYLTEYVEEIDYETISPDIEKIVIQRGIDINCEERNIITKVVSFNYSNTYEKKYLSKQTGLIDDNIHYIHGKADCTNTVDTNNMILGIDEYYKDARKNENVEFIAFKKFYQRIYKGTGSKYREWIDDIVAINSDYLEKINTYKEELKINRGMGYGGYDSKTKLKELVKNPPRHNLYIFGHSLDITDKDILKDLILNDNVYTTVFYCNKDALGQQIANLVQVIGQEELIRRTGGSRKTIEFKLQKNMEVRN